jgi:short-subunit dehydrogenase
MEVNYHGTVSVIRATLPHLMAQRSGHIVAISSVDGKKGLPKDAAYAASKFAVTGFMDVLRQELRGTGVYASTVFPERVDTPMIATLRLPRVSQDCLRPALRVLSCAPCGRGAGKSWCHFSDRKR